MLFLPGLFLHVRNKTFCSSASTDSFVLLRMAFTSPLRLHHGTDAG